jgi:hypothetical protein
MSYAPDVAKRCSVRWALVAMTAGLAGCGQRAPGEATVEVVVVAPRALLGGKEVSKAIGDVELERIRRRPEVVSVVPRMALRGPALGIFTIDGQEIRFEVGGFTDGIPADAIEPGLADRFVEPALGEDQPVPVVVSPTLVTLYNDRFAKAHGMPQLGEADIAVASRGDRLTFAIELGMSMVALERDPPWPRRTVKARVIGVSPRAALIGMTVPIGQVAAWNRDLLGDGIDVSYDSVAVVLRGASRTKPFAAWLERELALKLGEP